jgi:hypothetical protein
VAELSKLYVDFFLFGGLFCKVFLEENGIGLCGIVCLLKRVL